MTDDGIVVLGLGGGGEDCAREPPVSLGGLWKNSLFFVAVLSRCSHWEIWTSPSPLYLSVLGVWVMPVVYVLLVSGCVLCSVQQWIHVLQEAFDEFQYFLRCGELESWNVCSPFGLKCAQSMLLVAVFSARFVRGNLDIISVSAPFVAVCGGFLLLSATEPSMMKSSSSSRAEEFFITEGSG